MKPSGFALFSQPRQSPPPALPARAGHAQVTEPVIPPACITLKAAFTTAAATSGEIESRANSNVKPRHHPHPAGPRPLRQIPRRRTRPRLRKHRIPLRSLSPCAPASPCSSTSGVTLYASRNPTDYELSEGSCGLVNDAPAGCRPLDLRTQRHRLRHHGRRRHRRTGRRQNPPRRPSLRQVLVGPRRRRPHRRPPASSPPHRNRPHRRLHTLPHHPQKLSQLPHLLPPRRRPHRLGRQDRHTQHRAQHRRHRPRAVPQHHHHPLLHSHRRRQRRHQGGRRPHHQRERPRQPLLLRPRHVHRQRNQRRSQPILVRDLSLDGPDNGIRIKSNATRGGLVQDVIYENICIRNSKYPILFDTAYSFPGKGVQLLPVYDGITLRDVRISGGGRLQFNGFDHTHRIGVTLDGVLLLDDPPSTRRRPSTPTSPSAPAPSTPSSPATTPPSPARKSAAPSPPAPPASSPSPPSSRSAVAGCPFFDVRTLSNNPRRLTPTNNQEPTTRNLESATAPLTPASLTPIDPLWPN